MASLPNTYAYAIRPKGSPYVHQSTVSSNPTDAKVKWLRQCHALDTAMREGADRIIESMGCEAVRILLVPIDLDEDET